MIMNIIYFILFFVWTEFEFGYYFIFSFSRNK